MKTDAIKFKRVFDNYIDSMRNFIERMPHKGDTCQTSQKVCLQNTLKELEKVVNGIEQSDLDG